MSPASRQAGFTLMEAMMVLLIASVAAAGMTAVFNANANLLGVESVDQELQSEGERALVTIIRDIRETGRVLDVGGVSDADYPYFFANGVATGSFSGYSHTPATQHVPSSSPAYGPSTEIVFKVLADVDGDGKVTDQGDGSIEWDTDDFGYLLVTGADGINRLMRRNLTDGTETTVATHVERVIFEDRTIDASLGLNHVRITLHFAKEDPNRPGWYSKRFLVSVVNMRNVTGQGLILGS